MSGWEGFNSDLAAAGLSSLPSLQQSGNPDVSRFARGASEVVYTVGKRFILLEILSTLTLFALIPYWFGVAAFVLAVGLTGWGILAVAWVLGVMVPLFLLLAPLPEKALFMLVVLAGAGLGIWALATGFFSTIPS